MPRSGTILVNQQETPESFGASVRSLRQLLRISQQSLGNALHYSQRLISDIENGKVAASKEFQEAFRAFSANPNEYVLPKVHERKNDSC